MEYHKLKYLINHENDLKKKRVLINKCFKVLSVDFHAIDFKRLFYVRYVDNWVILLTGSYDKAKTIYNKVSKKLQKLGLNLNMKKTYITSLKRERRCCFLGVDFFIRKYANRQKHPKPVDLVEKNTITGQRFVPKIVLHAPILKLLLKLKEKGFLKKNYKNEFFPTGKSNCVFLTHLQILNYFNRYIKEILYYYSCVRNKSELLAIVKFLNYSCALTLARKFKFKTLSKIYKKFGRNLAFENKIGKNYKILKPDDL